MLSKFLNALLVAVQAHEAGLSRIVVYALRSKHVVSFAMKLIEQWEAAVAELEVGDTRDCHEQVIRLAKGQVKAWRVWRAQSLNQN